MANLTSLQLVKSNLGISASDTSQDGILGLFVSAASQNVQNYLRRKLISQAVTEVYSSVKQRVMLRHYPLADASQVTLVEVRVGQTWIQLPTSTSITVRPDIGHLEFFILGVFGVSNISSAMDARVTYTGGYDCTFDGNGNPAPTNPAIALPTDIVLATTLLSCHLYNKRLTTGISSERTDKLQVQYDTEKLPVEITKLLDPYRSQMPC